MTGRVIVLRGDAANLPLPDSSVDAVVTDPPYGLEFMGREWDAPWRGGINADAGFSPVGFGDGSCRLPRPTFTGSTNPHCRNCGGRQRGRRDGTAIWKTCTCEKPEFPNVRAVEMRAFQEWCETWAAECLRVLKPGGYLLAFSGTRTWHRLTCAIEDAGFEIRESVADLTGIDGPGLLWMQGSGFPKSLSVHKAILSTVESNYGSTRCDCLDARDGRTDRDNLGREGGCASGPGRGTGQVPAYQAREADVPLRAGGDQRPVRQLRADDTQEAAGSPPRAEALLQPDMRGRRPEAPGLGDPALWAGLEEPAGGDPQEGQGVPGLREDSRAERRGASRPSPASVPVRGDEPPGEPGGAVRPVPSRDRGDDGPGAGVDPGRREPRKLVPDDHRGGQAAVVRVCSWCGLPDDGWLDSLVPLGTALKPAWEPIVVARKPLAGTVAANVLTYGTGALNIDGCRVGSGARVNHAGGASSLQRVSRVEQGYRPTVTTSVNEDSEVTGRWPPNVLLGEEAAVELDRQSGNTVSKSSARQTTKTGTAALGNFAGTDNVAGHDDSGGASRFFPVFRYEAKADASERPRLPDGTAWPTVKPVALMRWLARLVTPPGGLILDPFCGTGTTGEAALIEGFSVVLADKDPQALALTRVRLAKPLQPVLFGDFDEEAS